MGKAEASRSFENGGDVAVVGPIDRVHLGRYTLGDLALENEVLKLFVDQSLRMRENLASADAAEQWRDAAHAIKGSARVIGAWRLAECAERAEFMPSGIGVGDRTRCLSDLDIALDEVCAHVKLLLARAPGIEASGSATTGLSQSA